MDDPWGSPWATSDTNTKKNLEPAVPAVIGLPPRSLTKIPSFTTYSPWDNDDGGGAFDGWGSSDLSAPAPTATHASLNARSSGTNGSLNAWAGWVGETGSNSSQNQLTPIHRDSLDQLSPIAWPAAVNSPGLGKSKTLSRRSSTRSLFRQPSPDPWTTEFHRDENQSSRLSSTQYSFERTPLPPLSNVVEEKHDRIIEKETRRDEKAQHAQDLSTFTWSKGGEASSVADGDEGLGDEDNGYQALEPEPLEPKPEQLATSRRSSYSGDSRHEDDRQDSPITSMDEDAKDRPQIQRKVSTKVHELVNMFEKKAEELSVVVTDGSRRPSSSRAALSIRSIRDENGTEDGDFGDFEDAEDSKSFVLSRQPSIGGSPTPSVKSKSWRTRSTSHALHRDVVVPAPPMLSPALEEDTSSARFRGILEKFGTVKYTADLDSIDQMFDKDKLDAEQPTWKDYSLDAADKIITDNFTTTSERRTWYRISRHGSARKHDTGEDENYRRVAWSTSKVRDETTKIVRRWMDEDSFSGTFSSRPAFGGGPSVKGGGMFNWDSKAEPVALDQVFGKRRSMQVEKPPVATATGTARPLSLQPLGSGPALLHSRKSSLSSKHLQTRSPLSIPAPPTAPVFGWSTGNNGGSSTRSSSRPTIHSVRQSIDNSRPGSRLSKEVIFPQYESESRSSLQLPPLTPTSIIATSITTKAAHVDEGDDDDDWGEMVASPPSNSRPASGFFDSGINGFAFDTGSDSPRPPPHPLASVLVPETDTSATLDAVSSRLQQSHVAASPTLSVPATTLSSDPWDFSLFDNTPVTAPTPAVSATQPVSNFNVLQSQRTPSPALHNVGKSIPTPTMRRFPHHVSSLSVSLNARRPPNGMSQPHHRASVSQPTNATSMPLKAVNFAPGDEEILAAQRITSKLPDLSYMLR